jgi:MarR family 2-MHQ and catechol resistance regulon transcriptional repressor
MDLDSNKGMPELIREIAWNFGARGLQGECCGGLLQPEFRTLCLASDRRQCSMQEIARSLGITKSGVTRLVNRLEKKGYVERLRSPEDGRVCCVKVTPPGRELVKTISRQNQDRIDRIMAKIDPAMQAVIETALRSFVQAIQDQG